MKEKIGKIYKKYELQYVVLIALLYLGQIILYESSKVLNPNWHLINMKIDDYIPFCKYFIIFYCTYYFYAPVLLYLVSLKDKKKFQRLFISTIMCCIISNACFLIYQVKMIRPEIIGNDIFDIMVKTIYSLDGDSVNCFPSLHAAIGMLMVIGGCKTKDFPKWLQIVSIVCGVGCILSTVFIKQHYFVDMIAGTILMSVCYTIVCLFEKKKKRETN